MSGVSLLSIVAMLGWLVLALGAYRSHQIGAKKSLVMALIWGSLFLGVTFFFTMVGS